MRRYPEQRNERWSGDLKERLKWAGYRVLSRGFYLRNPGVVARNLLGKYLVRGLGGTLLIGRIVETEAYYGSDDPASHAFGGMTPRNKLMFGTGGKAYIYLAYGNHYLLNIVTGTTRDPGAVLIRAVEPVDGIKEMLRLRRVEEVHRLTNGPGRLAKSFAIQGELSGCDLTDSELLVCRRIGDRRPSIAVSPRIGISRGKELWERYYIPGSRFLSVHPGGRGGRNPRRDLAPGSVSRDRTCPGAAARPAGRANK